LPGTERLQLTLSDCRPIAIRAEAFRMASPDGDQVRIILDDGQEISVVEAFDEVLRRFRTIKI